MDRNRQASVGNNHTTGYEKTVGEIVTGDYNKSAIFREAGIDFCFNGSRSLKEACEIGGLDLDDIINRLKTAGKTSNLPKMDFQCWNTRFLMRYIEQVHHQYILSNTPFVAEFAQKVARTDGARHPEIVKVAEVFSNTGNQLMLYTQQDEQSLFTLLYHIEAENEDDAVTERFEKSKEIVALIRKMEPEYKRILEDFKQIRKLTDNYQVPKYTTVAYGILFKLIKEYEDDLYLYFHLKNNILFPKALG